MGNIVVKRQPSRFKFVFAACMVLLVFLFIIISANRFFFLKNHVIYLEICQKHEEATALLHEMNKQYPHNSWIKKELLRQYNSLMEDDKAYEIALTLKKIGEVDPEMDWAFGIHYLSQNNLKKAIMHFAMFQESILTPKENGETIDTYRSCFISGLNCALNGKTIEAEHYLKKSHEMKEGFFYYPFFMIGKMYLNAGFSKKAQETFSYMIARIPENPELYYNLGVAYYNVGDFDRFFLNLDTAAQSGMSAYETFVQCKASGSSSYTINFSDLNGMRCLTEGLLCREGGALESAALEASGKLKMLDRLGEYDQMENILAQFSNPGSPHSGVYYHLARVSLSRKASHKARAYLLKELAVNPLNLNAHLLYQTLPRDGETTFAKELEQSEKEIDTRTRYKCNLSETLVFENHNNETSRSFISSGKGTIMFSMLESKNYLILIEAHGEPAGKVWPVMEVSIDSKVPSRFFYVDDSQWQVYAFTAYLESGPHELTIEFTNDEHVWINEVKEDRNLYVNNLRIMNSAL